MPGVKDSLPAHYKLAIPQRIYFINKHRIRMIDYDSKDVGTGKYDNRDYVTFIILSFVYQRLT